MLPRGATMLIRYKRSSMGSTPGNVEIGKLIEKTRIERFEPTLANIQMAEGREKKASSNCDS